MAQLLLEQNPPDAKAAIEQALKTNPNYVPAHLFAAEIALDERRRDDATASIDAALKVNPNSLDARSLQAAVAFLEGRDAEFERLAQEILKINPIYGDVYRTAGDHPARNYRFDEAVVLTRRAVAIDPDNARAHADLGLQLMRTGDEAAARTSLEAAYKGDPFHSSLLTKNLLTLLDELDNEFETITDGKIVMKLHTSEVGVMREHALPLAKESLATLEKRYQFKAQGPILVEMFPKHDDFAVRTLGLPGMIGALGACFGRVVTLDSPQGAAAGRVQLGRDAVARDGARHHAADVEQPPAALAQRRHVGVRGAARASRVGQGDGRRLRAGARAKASCSSSPISTKASAIRG